MQKNTKNELKILITRIFPLACFISALIIAPLTALNKEIPNNIVYNSETNDVSVEVSDVITGTDTDISDTAVTVTPETDNATQEEVGTEITEESPSQSEEETLEAVLTESYMLRELFAGIDFSPENDEPDSVPDEDDTPVQTQTPSGETTPPEVTGTVPPVTDTPEVTDTPTDTTPVSADPVPPTPDVPSTTKGSITTVRVLNHNDKTVSVMDLDEYIASVIISEMPSYAGDEALKAQAVACRTFVVNRIVNSATHEEADVCTNPGHCQAFLGKDDFISKYGESGNNFYVRAYNAAKTTSGVIVTYQGSPITAAFHASSGGSTLSSADVWGGHLPYLVSVYSPEQDDPEMRKLISAHKSFTKEDFIRSLTAAGYSAAGSCLELPFESFVGPVTHTAAGKVDSVTIAGEVISGQQLKSIFSLRSGSFSISYNENNITFTCLGYGHGVGMSQLGACTMAKKGSTYTEILKHYYTGVDVLVW